MSGVCKPCLLGLISRTEVLAPENFSWTHTTDSRAHFTSALSTQYLENFKMSGEVYIINHIWAVGLQELSAKILYTLTLDGKLKQLITYQKIY